MGTRSTVAVETIHGTIEQIYVHWDGHISGVGQKLLEGYNHLPVASALVKLGGVSCILDTVSDTAREAYTARGESLVISTFVDVEDYMRRRSTQEYNYLLHQHNGVPTWVVSYGHHDTLYILAHEIADLDKEDKF